MTLELLRDFLGWCTLINMGILIVWALMLFCCRAWIYRIHGKLFPMSEERFNSIHYAWMGNYKMGMILFNLVPYLALRIVGD